MLETFDGILRPRVAARARVRRAHAHLRGGAPRRHRDSPANDLRYVSEKPIRTFESFSEEPLEETLAKRWSSRWTTRVSTTVTLHYGIPDLRDAIAMRPGIEKKKKTEFKIILKGVAAGRGYALEFAATSARAARVIFFH